MNQMYASRTWEMLEHASWKPFLRDWIVSVYQFRSIAYSHLELLEMVRERGCINPKRGQVVAIVLRTVVCHVAGEEQNLM